MITIETLKAFGANTDEGLKRCLNNEGFYLNLVKTVVPDTRINDLEAALAEKDLEKAFEIAHALKGMYANLALTPLTEPVSELTELLRSKTPADYTPLLAELKKQKAALDEL